MCNIVLIMLNMDKEEDNMLLYTSENFFLFFWKFSFLAILRPHTLEKWQFLTISDNKNEKFYNFSINGPLCLGMALHVPLKDSKSL